MPLGLAAAAIIGASLGFGGSVLNSWSQSRTNKQQEAYNREMYERQRRDALSDFDRQNAFNSPEQQMNRLRQAGLNPHLVYGKGADNTAMAVRSSSPQSYSPIAPKIDTSHARGGLMDYFEIRQRKAQTDNVEAQTALAGKESLLKDAQIASITQSTATSQFELAKSKELKDLVVKKAILDNEATAAHTKIALDQNERNKLLNTVNVVKTVQEILHLKLRNEMNPLERDQLKQMIRNAENEGALRAKDLEWRRDGLTPSDPIYWRVLSDWLKSNSQRTKEYTKTVDDFIKKSLKNKNKK